MAESVSNVGGKGRRSADTGVLNENDEEDTEVCRHSLAFIALFLCVCKSPIHVMNKC